MVSKGGLRQGDEVSPRHKDYRAHKDVQGRFHTEEGSNERLSQDDRSKEDRKLARCLSLN
jgi:hypothetical protein